MPHDSPRRSIARGAASPGARAGSGTNGFGQSALVGLCCLAVMILAVNATAMNVALPSMARQFNADLMKLQWIVLAYNVAVFAAVLVAGLVGDRCGHMRTLRAGLLLFAVASLAGAFATGAGQLIVLRAVMGVGAAVVTPMTLSLIRVRLAPAVRGRAIALWTGATAVGMPLGPLLGGYLVDRHGWPAIMLVSAAAAAAVRLGLVFGPRRPSPRPVIAVHSTPAATSFVVAAGVFVYAVTDLGRGRPSVLGPIILIGSGCALAATVYRHRRADRSPFRVSAGDGFGWSCALIFLLFFAVMGVLFLAPLFLQGVIGYSATESGLWFLPLAICLIVASLVSQRASRRLGIRTTVVGGLGCLTVGLSGLTVVDGRDDTLVMAISLGLVGAGVGCAQTTLTDFAVSVVAEREAGKGSALINLWRQLGGIVGVAVVGALTSRFHHVGATGQHDSFVPAFGLAVTGCAAIACVAAVIAQRHLPTSRPANPAAAPRSHASRPA